MTARCVFVWAESPEVSTQASISPYTIRDVLTLANVLTAKL